MKWVCDLRDRVYYRRIFCLEEHWKSNSILRTEKMYNSCSVMQNSVWFTCAKYRMILVEIAISMDEMHCNWFEYNKISFITTFTLKIEFETEDLFYTWFRFHLT